MSFIYPLFLFALLALVIPVLIHLFNFKRYKTLYFSNVPLLKQIRQESKKKSQLKHLLILITRLIAFVFLVFAFSRPYFPSAGRVNTNAQQIVGIFIDNSFSMKSEGENGQLLEQAKLKAIEIANSYPVGTQYLVLTCDFLPQHEFIFSKDQFLQQVSEIKESCRSPKLSQVYAQAVRIFSTSAKKSEKTFYILSDFQKNSTDIGSVKSDPSIWAYLLPFKAVKSANLLIDSCWFDVPGRKIGQQEKLFVRVKNLSSQSYQNIPIRLMINDSLKAISNITIAGNEQSIQELNYTNNTNGIQLCKVELDDYPIIYDNSFYLSYRVHGKINALGIFNPRNNGSDYLKTLFAEDELINYNDYPESNIQISQFKTAQCIFLLNNMTLGSGVKTELSEFVKDGGSLVIFPDRSIKPVEINPLLSAVNSKLILSFDTTSMNISTVNYNHELYRNVFKKQETDADLPVIKGTVLFADRIQEAETPLLTFRNGKNALSVHQYGKGKVYTFAFPLDKSNLSFIKHVLFVPTIYNIALNSGAPQEYARSTENDEPVVLNIPESGELKLVNPQTKEEFIISTRTMGNGEKQLLLDEVSKTSGHFLVESGNQILQSISFNYPRKESSTDYCTSADFEKLMSSTNHKTLQLLDSKARFDETLQILSSGNQLWKYCILLSLLFLLCEVAIIRLWK